MPIYTHIYLKPLSPQQQPNTTKPTNNALFSTSPPPHDPTSPLYCPSQHPPTPYPVPAFSPSSPFPTASEEEFPRNRNNCKSRSCCTRRSTSSLITSSL